MEEEERSTDPVLSAHCEAAGLELAVRTWWRGAPGRRTQREDAWLQKNAAGGVQAGAHQRLMRCGIPESVLRSGVQLGQALAKDAGVSKNWRQVVENASTCDSTRRIPSTPTVASPQGSPNGQKSARDVVRKFQVKLMQEVSQNFDLRLPKSTAGGLQLSPRRKRPEVEPSLASARGNEADEPFRYAREADQADYRLATPLVRPSSEDAGHQQDPRSKGYGRALVVLPTLRMNEVKDGESERPASKGSRPVLRAPSKDSTDSRSGSKGPRSRHRMLDFSVDAQDVPERDAPKAFTASEDIRQILRPPSSTDRASSPGDSETGGFPRRTRSKLQDIFAETSSKLLEHGLEPPGSRSVSLRPGSSQSETVPMSPRAFSKGGSPKRALTTSRFDEWSKKQEVKKTEQAKEYEEECRKMERATESIQALKTSTLLNDKNVAAEVMHKKAVHDLNDIRRIFSHFDQDGSGFIEPPEFIPLLAKLLRRPAEDLDRGEVWAVWDQVDADGSGSIDFDEFQKWYAELMGIDILDYKQNFIPDDISEDQKMVRSVAKSLGRTILEVEKLYDEFRKLDADNSNTLERDEFKVLIQRHFAPKGPEVPEHVFKMFWKDFDKDGKGSVTFIGFVKWYLKFMKGDQDPMQMYFAYMSASR